MRLYEQKETWKYMPLGRIITMVIEAIDSKSRVKCKNDKSYVPKNKLCLHWYAKSNDCYVIVIHWSLHHLSRMLFSRSFLFCLIYLWKYAFWVKENFNYVEKKSADKTYVSYEQQNHHA